MKKDEIALKILCALLSNPERYNYISHLVDSKKITQEQANEKTLIKPLKWQTLL